MACWAALRLMTQCIRSIGSTQAVTSGQEWYPFSRFTTPGALTERSRVQSGRNGATTAAAQGATSWKQSPALDGRAGPAWPELAGGSQRPISMTTHSLPVRHATFLRAGCDRRTSHWASVVTGFVALWVTAASGLLYFANADGPLGEYPRLVGALAGLGAGPSPGPRC